MRTHEPIGDNAERKKISALIEQCEKEQMMSRYIDIETIKPRQYENSEVELGVLAYDYDEVDAMPFLDICFCRECKKSHIDGKTTHYLWCTEWGRSTDVFGYCERGEREGE